MAQKQLDVLNFSLNSEDFETSVVPKAKTCAK